MPDEISSGASSGPATDRTNTPVVDPSENVKSLNLAANQRQDDLREMQAAHTDAVREMQQAHIESLLALRAEFAKDIREAQIGATDEKFRSIDMQLALIERQRVEQKADTQKAVDAALAAQKEAVREQTTASDLAIGKSENAMTKQVDQQGETFATAIQGTERSLGDIKERVSRIETLKQGGTDNRGAVLAVMAASIGVLSLVASIVFALLR